MHASNTRDKEPFPCSGYDIQLPGVPVAGSSCASGCIQVCQRLHPGVRLGVHARLQEQGGSTVDHLGDSMVLFCHPSLDARPKSGSSQIISKGSH